MNNIDRNYRYGFKNKDLHFFNLCIYESDLFIGIDKSLDECIKEEIEEKSLKLLRRLRESLIKANEIIPNFFRSLKPIPYNIEELKNSFNLYEYDLISRMILASNTVGVGPMASVAGGISQILSDMISKYTKKYIVENGGDIYASYDKNIAFSVYAGESSLSNKFKISVESSKMPLGICTSSGKVGNSLSLGNADSITVIDKDTFLADAAATFLGNIIRKADDMMPALEYAEKNFDLLGIFIIIEEQIGIRGDIILSTI